MYWDWDFKNLNEDVSYNIKMKSIWYNAHLEYVWSKSLKCLNKMLSTKQNCTSAAPFLTPFNFSCFLKWKFISTIRFENVEDLQRNKMAQIHTILEGLWLMEKLIGISILHAKRVILMKLNVLFIVYICLGKYCFSLHTFWT